VVVAGDQGAQAPFFLFCSRIRARSSPPDPLLPASAFPGQTGRGSPPLSTRRPASDRGTLVSGSRGSWLASTPVPRRQVSVREYVMQDWAGQKPVTVVVPICLSSFGAQLTRAGLVLLQADTLVGATRSSGSAGSETARSQEERVGGEKRMSVVSHSASLREVGRGRQKEKRRRESWKAGRMEG
jgi:hypothetical protein